MACHYESAHVCVMAIPYAGLDAGFQKGGFILGNFKQKRMKFLNFHQNPHENELILAKRGFEQSH